MGGSHQNAMKLPLGFGNKIVFRLLFPGAVLAAVMVRPVHSVAYAYGLKIPIGVSFIGEAPLWGWLLLLLDTQIYMLFEGRRWWPQWLMRVFRGLERRRLLRIIKTFRYHDRIARRIENGKPVLEALRRPRVPAARTRNISLAISLEEAAKLDDFPLNRQTAMFAAPYPTRLGNLIAAYEQYPDLKYKLDSVFFWPRMWVSIDKDLRDDIDNQQALVDGALYVVAALALGATIFPVYGIVDLIWPTVLMYGQRPWMDMIAAVTCALTSRAIYMASLYTHSKFGSLFKATFDQYQTKIDLTGVVDFVATAAGNPALLNSSFLERNRAAYRFLRWQRVRRPWETKNRRVRT
jgi:hypothetical protein